MRATICTILAIFVMVAGAWTQAETIHLKDGSRMTGKIVGAVDDSIRFETSHGVLVVKREDIERIEYEPASPSHSSPEQIPVEPTRTPSVANKSIAESVVGESQNSNAATISPPKKGPVAILGAGYRFGSDETEGGPQGSFSLLAPVSNNFLVGGGLGFAHFNNKVLLLSKGTVTLIPVTAQLALRSHSGVAFTAGLGYAFASHKLDPEVTSFFASLGLGAEEEVNGAFTAEAALGLTGRMSETTKFGVSIGYQFLDTSAEATVTDLASGNFAVGKFDVNLSAPFIRAQLEF